MGGIVRDLCMDRNDEGVCLETVSLTWRASKSCYASRIQCAKLLELSKPIQCQIFQNKLQIHKWVPMWISTVGLLSRGSLERLGLVDLERAEGFGLKVFRCQTHCPHPPQGVNIVRNYIGHTKGILNWMLIRGTELINTLVRQLLSKDEKMRVRHPSSNSINEKAVFGGKNGSALVPRTRWSWTRNC